MEFTAKQIAEFIHGRIDGEEKTVVSSFAKIEEGKEGALSFLSNPKFLPYVYGTKSSIIIINDDINKLKERFDYSQLKTDNPLVINQTTLSFLELEAIHQEIKNKLPNAIFHDEICDATLLRQIAIKNLSSGIDTIIIVGSKTDSA